MASPWTADDSGVTADSGYYTADGSYVVPSSPPAPEPGAGIPVPAGLSLQQTINAYAFQQYADDDDIQLYFGMFNAASQAYLDWFNSTNLAYYPALSGPLLQWCAAGLYGQPYFSAIAAAGTPTIGPLNSATLNQLPLNDYIAPTEIYYDITDDIFQRILTWNLYKGDGKRFCVRWLKRRIMRFILGTNGIDPQPWNSGFEVGCENTQGVSVQFTTNYLSAPTQLTPSTSTSGGSLPATTAYYFKIVARNGFGVTLPSSEQTITTGSGSTNSITVNLDLVAGATQIEIWYGTTSGAEGHYFTAAGSATSFSFTTTTGSTAGTLPTVNTALGGQTCTVTLNQIVLSNLTQLTPNILQIFAALFVAPGTPQTGADWVLEKPLEYSYVVNIDTTVTALVSPGTLSKVGASTSESTGTATVAVLGGSGSYTYAWTWLAGGTGITINSATAAATSFTASALTSGETLTGVAKCTVTDTVSHATTSCAVNVSIERVSLPTATPSPASISATGTTANVTSGSVQAIAAGGEGPYSFAWSWQSGGTGINIGSPTTASTTFTGTSLAYGNTESGVALCTVTDFFGQTTTCTVPVSVSRVTALSAAISPSALSVTGASASETTGTTTVTPSGGVAPYMFSWAWQSGGSGITINSPSAATTSFTDSSLSPGTTASGTAVCTVTDSSGQSAQATCAVSLTRVSLVSASASPASESSSGAATTQTTGVSTVTASGGSGTYTYSWRWSGGGTDLTINSPSSRSTSFTGSSMVGGDTYTGTAQCTVTDGYGQTATANVSVSITCDQSLFVYASGSGHQTVPSWATNVVIEDWGGGAPGGEGNTTGGTQGGGGGAAGYARSSYACSGGQTIAYAVGAAFAASTVSSGTLSITTMTANTGTQGANATVGSGGAGGAGGTASGGNQANITGGAGQSGNTTGAGGIAQAGVYANNPASNGDGGLGSANSTVIIGRPGLVSFKFS